MVRHKELIDKRACDAKKNASSITKKSRHRNNWDATVR